MHRNFRLEEDIRGALVRDPRIVNDRDIAISGDGGLVTLRGRVSSFKQRRAAVEDSNSVKGVDEVFDELKVRPLPGGARDDEIRGVALQSLIWDTRVPADEIDVKVADRWVTLRGQVEHQYQSDAAFEDVASLRDVGGVTNEIRVVTPHSR